MDKGKEKIDVKREAKGKGNGRARGKGNFPFSLAKKSLDKKSFFEKNGGWGKKSSFVKLYTPLFIYVGEFIMNTSLI